MKVGIVVQGLFEKSDSIGYDAVFQYNILNNSGYNCTIYAEKFDESLYKGITIHGMEQFYKDFDEKLDKIIYHFCDGWEEIDRFIIENKEKFIIRWHNNTPPWFYVFKQKRFALRSLKGFEVISSFAAHNIKVMTNSKFTSEQFSILGGRKKNTSIVFPGSRYLFSAPEKHLNTGNLESNVINILFVGRFVAHKGHRNMIHVCDFLQKNSTYKVNLHIVGRGDKSLYEYNDEIKKLSEKSNVYIYGEVSEKKLYELYDTADVFLFLSEHEGFGLPVFEAMSRNLPLVAWRTSALDELLDNHPLAFKDFDIVNFASAIISLKEKKIRDSVLDIQKDISKIYSLKVVERQLNEAINEIEETEQGNKCKEIEKYNEIKIFLNDIYKGFGCCEYDAGFLHDFSGNFVSKYDLKVFRAFFDQEKEDSVDSVENLFKGKVRYVDIAYDKFNSHYGELNRNFLRIPHGHKYDNHIIFGPYININKGSYEIEIFFDSNVGNADQLLNIEISSSQNGLLCSLKRRIYNLKNIEFTVPTDDENFEVRISTSDYVHKDIIFKKIRLTQAISEKNHNSLAANLFSTHEGVSYDNIIDFPKKKYSNKDIIFGPYINMDRGYYSVSMIFDGEKNTKCAVKILDSEDNIIYEDITGILDIKNIEFNLKKNTSGLEFRVTAIDPFDGGISFLGSSLFSIRKPNLLHKIIGKFK
ncbi:glycosyltransferase [Asaia siamensis]